jgi:hypothetical protein
MRILVVTYYWPPAGGPGVQRWLKTSKALSALGHDVEVLTVSPEKATYPLLDDPSLKGSHRPAGAPHGGTRLVWRLPKAHPTKGSALQRLRQPSRTSRPHSTPVSLHSREFLSARPSTRMERLRPEQSPTVTCSLPFDVVITTGPPHSTHLIGRALKRQQGHLVGRFS